MKKSLLMMAVALTAMSASAQLYVTGAKVQVGDQTNSWDAKNALECAVEGDYYTFQANGEFAISTVKADWDAGWKTGTYTLNGAWNLTETSATGNLQRVDGNIPAAKVGEMVTYKVKNDYSTIEATFSSGVVETNFRLHGNIFTGTEVWETKAMTLKNGKWEYTGDVVPGDFGMKECDPTGEQLVWIGGAAAVTEAGNAYSFVEGANSSTTLSGTYTIVYDPQDKTITFNGNGVTPPRPVEDLVLAGDFNSWAVNDRAFLMTRNGSTYTYSMDAIEANTMFKVKTAEDEWTTSWGAEGDPSWTEAQPVAVTPNVAMNAWPGSGCNFLVENALTNVTITFVKSDDASVASTLTVQGQSAIETVEAAAAEAPAQYYNLQGIRVLAPEAGQLYIVNRAGKVSKEIAR